MFPVPPFGRYAFACAAGFRILTLLFELGLDLMIIKRQLRSISREIAPWYALVYHGAIRYQVPNKAEPLSCSLVVQSRDLA